MRPLWLLLMFSLSCSEPSRGASKEYPDLKDAATAEDRNMEGGTKEDVAPVSAGDFLLREPVFARGVTEEGDLVFEHGGDLKLLLRGASAPELLSKDFRSSDETVTVRENFVALWGPGEGRDMPLSVWSRGHGLVHVSDRSLPEAFFPAKGDAYGFSEWGASLLASDLVTVNEGGSPAVLLPDLHNGVTRSDCAPQVTHLGAALLVRGCVGENEGPKVRLVQLDGSQKVLLTDADRALWVNPERTHAVLQNEQSSSLHELTLAGDSYPLDGPVVQVRFRGPNLVFLTKSGVIKRGALRRGAELEVVARGAKALLLVDDSGARVAFAKSGDLEAGSTDVWLADESGTTQVVAKDGRAVGWTSGGALVHLQALDRFGSTGDLMVLAQGETYATKMAGEVMAHQVVVVGESVVWLARRDPALWRSGRDSKELLFGGLPLLVGALHRAPNTLYASGTFGLARFDTTAW